MVNVVFKILFPTGKSLMTTLRLLALEDVYEEMQRYRQAGCSIKILSLSEDSL